MKTPSLLRAATVALCLGAAGAFAAEAPAASAAPEAASSPEKPKAGSYRIQPTDKLSISVAQEPDLSVVGKKVDINGNITVQLLTRDIHVAGLTLKEAQAAIENAYRDGRILRNPQVFVNIEEYAPREVTVNGYVKFPAKVQILPETILTLKDAISKCGGLQDTAAGRKVTVTRLQPDGTFKVIEPLDVESALLGKKTSTVNDANFVLEPGDVVYVRERVI